MKHKLFVHLLLCVFPTVLIAKAPSWVENLRNGEQSLVVNNDGKKLFRAFYQGKAKDDEEKVCEQAIQKAKRFLNLAIPNLDGIPILVELFYYDESENRCYVTLSVSDKVEVQKPSSQRRDRPDSDSESPALVAEKYLANTSEVEKKAMEFAIKGVEVKQMEQYLKLDIDTNLVYYNECNRQLNSWYGFVKRIMFCWTYTRNSEFFLTGYCLEEEDSPGEYECFKLE